MPQKKNAESDTAIIRGNASLPATDFVKVEKNLNSLGFFTPSSKAIKGTKAKTITFSRTVDGKKVEAKVTIAPAALYGLPVTADQDKYLALQKIITDIKQEQGSVSNPIGFTSAEILRLLGHADSGKNFHDVHEWMKRMTATTIISEGAVFFAGRKKWARDIFRVFDRSVAVGEELEDGRVSDRHYVWLSNWQLENINANHLLPIDFETYKKLKSHIGKALVPMLQVWLFASVEKGSCEKRYDELCQYLNISQYRHLSKIREKLGPALNELKSHGYISRWKIEPTSDKTSFKIIFFHGEKFHRDRQQRLGQTDAGDQGQPSAPDHVKAKEESGQPAPPATQKAAAGPTGAEDPAMTRRIERLVEAGFAKSIAEDLASKYPDECDRQLDALPSRNLAKVNDRVAWLRCAIEKGYALPAPPDQGLATKQEEAQKSADCSFCKDSAVVGMRRIATERYPNGVWKDCSHDPEVESKYTPAV
ncbi:MAG TPA: replication initiator protein A [Blastocatellia bacterium]